MCDLQRQRARSPQLSTERSRSKSDSKTIAIQVVDKVPQAEVSVQRNTGSGGKEEIKGLR